MSIRCIVLDLDKTTLNKEGKLSAENRAAIESCIKKGIEIIIASGRPYNALPQEVTEIAGIHYAITSNGAAVCHVPSGECMVRYLLSKRSVGEIISVVSEPVNRGLIACEGLVDGLPHCSADYHSDPMKYGAYGHGVDYIRGTRFPEKDILGFIKANQDKMDCINIVVNDHSLKEQLWVRLQSEVSNVYMTSSLERLIEISDKNSGKHSAVRRLLNLLHISPEEAAAFGDGDNDAGMLSFVGAGVAVENATKLCKQSADYITASYDQNGVAKWIDEVLPKI